jgi:hypothetical protein
MPKALHGKPAIINLFHPANHTATGRIQKAEQWIGAKLTRIGSWGHGFRNSVYVANLEPAIVTLSDLVEDAFEPGIGWFPLELPVRLLTAYRDQIPARTTVWDGFCGRGTVGKACQLLGFGYIGLDIDANRVRLARDYLVI